MMKNTQNAIKIVTAIFFTTSFLSLFQKIVYAVPTKWEKVDISLAQLLNNGWQISGHSSNRTAVGNAGAANNYDQETFTYLLTKNGKYITCLIVNPSPPTAESASCRMIN